MGFFASKYSQMKLLGLDLSAHYLLNDFLSLGIYGSGNKLFSNYKPHRIFATGGEIELSFFRYWMLRPYANTQLGFNTDRYIGEYSDGAILDRRNEGINSSFSFGLKTNFENTNSFQFALSAGLFNYSRKVFDIYYTGDRQFFQFGIKCIYLFD